jgi:hypothetical protein
MMGPPQQNSAPPAPHARPVTAIYTNAVPALVADRKSIAGKYVIAEFARDTDLSLPTTDSDKVFLKQDKDVKTAAGKVYAASVTVFDNAGGRGNNAVIRGIDAGSRATGGGMMRAPHGWDTASTFPSPS